MDQREVGLSYTAGPGTLTVTAPPNGNIAPPGYYLLFILNQSGVPSVASFVQLATTLPDFSLSATPASQLAAPGSGTSYTLNIAGTNGFAGSVSFSVTGLPSGVTPSFTPAAVTGAGSSNLSITTTSSTPMGTYPLTVTATSGALSHSTSVTLVVADFPISASPISQTIATGSKATYTVTVTAQGPFSAAVNMTLSGAPKRTNSTFSPTSVNGSGSSTLRISTNRNAVPGNSTLTITGTGGGISHSTTVGLNIQ
jgi:hypothetical protein